MNKKGLGPKYICNPNQDFFFFAKYGLWIVPIVPSSKVLTISLLLKSCDSLFNVPSAVISERYKDSYIIFYHPERYPCRIKEICIFAYI